jgi:hypothetical protein
MQPENTGDPLKSPFVYYVSGVPVFPPNDIREVAISALDESEKKPLGTVLQERVKRGFVGGTVAVLPEFWWNQFLLNYVKYFANNYSQAQEMEHHAGEALGIMTSTPAPEAWAALVDFAIHKMDVLADGPSRGREAGSFKR